jgi:membrane protease YdiL (CAAX protease family)
MQPYPGPMMPYAGPMGYWPVPPPPPRVWPCFVTVGCVFAGHLTVGILLAVTVIALRGPGAAASPDELSTEVARVMGQPPVFLALMGMTVLVTLAGGVIPGLLSPVPFTRRLRLTRTRTRWWQDVLLVVAAIGVSWALAGAISLLHLDREGVLVDLDKSLRQMRGPMLALAILVIGIVGPIAEELLFRGYVQTRLRERWGPVPAVLIAAALFGFLHFDLIHSTFAFGLGLALGYATERAGSLRPAVWAHMINNTLSVLGSASGLGEPGDSTGAGWMLGISAAVAVVCVIIVELKRPAPAPA